MFDKTKFRKVDIIQDVLSHGTVHEIADKFVIECVNPDELKIFKRSPFVVALQRSKSSNADIAASTSNGLIFIVTVHLCSSDLKRRFEECSRLHLVEKMLKNINPKAEVIFTGDFNFSPPTRFNYNDYDSKTDPGEAFNGLIDSGYIPVIQYGKTNISMIKAKLYDNIWLKGSLFDVSKHQSGVSPIAKLPITFQDPIKYSSAYKWYINNYSDHQIVWADINFEPV